MPKTVTALFDEIKDAERAIEGLLDTGVRHADISLVANIQERMGVVNPREADTGKIRARAVGAAAADSLGLHGSLVPTPESFQLKGIGASLAAGLIADVLEDAQGRLPRALTQLGLPREDADLASEAVRRGGTLLLARMDTERVPRALKVFREHRVVDIEERVQAWRARGWTAFDESAAPLTGARLAQERQLAPPRLKHEPGETRPTDGAGGGVWSGKAPFSDDEQRIAEHARAEWLETIHTRFLGPEAGAPQGAADALDSDFRDHYRAIYASSGRAYEELEMGYRYGAIMASSPRFAEGDWTDSEADVRAEWERAQPGTWTRYRDAIRYGWGRRRGQAYGGPERRRQSRPAHYQYRW